MVIVFFLLLLLFARLSSFPVRWFTNKLAGNVELQINNSIKQKKNKKKTTMTTK